VPSRNPGGSETAGESGTGQDIGVFTHPRFMRGNPGNGEEKREGGGEMTFKMILVLILSGLTVVFILQNSDEVQVSFLIWHVTLSRALVIFFSLLVGFVLGWFLNSYFFYRKAKKELSDYEL
jgi:uncharacterized integral membrane protein